MRKNNHIREKIIKLLRKHPEGIPILEVARLVESHRHTVTKYVYEMVGAGVIQIREVGTAKLCVLKKGFMDRTKQKAVLKKLRR